MSAKPQGRELVKIISPTPTVLRCLFPRSVRLHECVQNVVHLQVEYDQIILVRRPSLVLSNIIDGLQQPQSQSRLIAGGWVQRGLLELRVRSADLLDLALAPVSIAINGSPGLQAEYQNGHMRPITAFA